MKSFRQLLEEVLQALEGREAWSETLRSETKAQASLPPKGEDPVAQALHRARQGLWALLEGREEEACRLLLEAVRLHPNLGGGLALKVGVKVCQEGEKRRELEEIRARQERAWEKASPMVHLLRLLKDVPFEAWEPLFAPEPKEAPKASPRPAPKAPVGRPFRTFPLRPSTGRQYQGGAYLSMEMQVRWEPWQTPEPEVWTSPDQDFHLRGNTLMVNLRRLPAARGTLFYLQGPLGSILVPLEERICLPPLAPRGETLQAELWRWEDLTPEAFLDRYRRATHAPWGELAAWLEAGVREGKLDPETWPPVLKAVRVSLGKGSRLENTMTLDIGQLERWLWDAACAIRGPVDAPKFKDFILPLVFLKRLSDVFEDELEHLGAEFGSRELALELVEEERRRGRVTLVRFYIPEEARWETIRSHGQRGLGQHLTRAVRAVARENPTLAGVIDLVDFNTTAAGQRVLPDEHLAHLVEVLSRHRLGLRDVEPDVLGRAYEYLLRKFAEGQGQSAGEFYTPREVALLMARLLEPEPGMEVYDPACGSGGLLIKAQLRLLERYGVAENSHRRLPPGVAPLRLFGQEINPTTHAIAWMNAVLHDLEADIRLGDTLRRPAFLDEGGRLRRFDLVVANPMWNQEFPQEFYESDPYRRFAYGIPPRASGDWGWIQHMLASLKEGGRMAVVLDTGAVSRGSGNQGASRERDIRKRFVEEDLVEAVVLLPENLFYNTPAPGVILVLNRKKRHPRQILLVNASQLFEKERPKNRLAEAHLETIAQVYHAWEEREGLSRIITLEEAALNDYNLSPSRYVATNGAEEVLPLEEAWVRLLEAEEERAEAERRMWAALEVLGLQRGGVGCSGKAFRAIEG